MPSRAKKPLSQSDKEQELAEIVVKAAKSFEYLHLTLDDIGIPPLTATKKECSGHSWKSFCAVCRFNFCWMCGGAVHNPGRRDLITCWKGACALHPGPGVAPSVEHHGRVLALAKTMMGIGGAPAPVIQAAGEQAEPIVVDSDEEIGGAGGGWAGDRMIGGAPRRPAPRIQLARAPPARKVRRVAPPAAEAVVAPQVNIAIAPLARVRVEGSNTVVRTLGDGAMGRARFEVTVTIVLEQM